MEPIQVCRKGSAKHVHSLFQEGRLAVAYQRMIWFQTCQNGGRQRQCVAHAVKDHVHLTLKFGGPFLGVFGQGFGSQTGLDVQVSIFRRGAL